ncbi:DUF262 domain-containing protein [Rothia sp. CCM 9416]|uniref:DUF262 domain-containing protein n=1 Tax=Rothia sp. CCM 9416 TaxID=3402655 RepID=UPI003ADCCA52
MKAVDSNLLDLLKKSERFVVPIYQRVYSWGKDECQQLWKDIMRAGSREALANHFTGSIVYIERDQGSNTAKEPDLLIDGQQRVTTVTLVLSALASYLETLPKEQQEPIAGFSPQKIRGKYLTNEYEEGDEYFKLTLTHRDRDALQRVVQGLDPIDESSRVTANFRYFVDQIGALDEPGVKELCEGLNKLVVVDVKLTRKQDDPQLVFESMNATGKKLSQADLIRNFVLMDVPQRLQARLYKDYWFPMERVFAECDERRFDEFVRHYLTMKTKKIPRLDDVYEAYKEFAFTQDSSSDAWKENLVADLYTYSTYFAAMAFGRERDQQLAQRFSEMEQLATVAYPFQLRVYADYEARILGHGEFVTILDALISYLFRRNICKIPTNSLNKTFNTLVSRVNPNDYVNSVLGYLLSLTDYRRFPADQEFIEKLENEDVYFSQKKNYLLHKLENCDSKEVVPTSHYTVEHIMPQTLTEGWKHELGDNWEEVHRYFLHTLGNLTLTGYNPEYSNRSFLEKRDMEGGFAQSPLRLNLSLRNAVSWGQEQMEARASELSAKAVQLWAYPLVEDGVIERYSNFDRSSFDWSTAHSILEVLPYGAWTNYQELAEAVGTGPQAMAYHLTNHAGCVNAYRVLTWEGRVSEGFRWADDRDTRDPLDVLVEDGVRLVDGVADADQRLNSAELLALLGEEGE